MSERARWEGGLPGLPGLPGLAPCPGLGRRQSALHVRLNAFRPGGPDSAPQWSVAPLDGAPLRPAWSMAQLDGATSPGVGSVAISGITLDLGRNVSLHTHTRYCGGCARSRARREYAYDAYDSVGLSSAV